MKKALTCYLSQKKSVQSTEKRLEYAKKNPTTLKLLINIKSSVTVP